MMDDSRFERLAGALRAGAEGLYTDAAATDLLIGHRAWLARTDFTTSFISLHTPESGRQVATVWWAEAIAALDAGELACSTSEADILRIAASIGADVPVELRACLGGLDERNLRLVLAAIAHANGTKVSIR